MTKRLKIPTNLKPIDPRCCWSCVSMFADADAWFCERPEGPRWSEFDMPFRHICDRWQFRAGHPPQDPKEKNLWFPEREKGKDMPEITATDQIWSLSGVRPMDNITIRNPNQRLFVQGADQEVTISYVLGSFVLRRGKKTVECSNEQAACDQLNAWKVEIRK